MCTECAERANLITKLTTTDVVSLSALILRERYPIAVIRHRRTEEHPEDL